MFHWLQRQRSRTYLQLGMLGIVLIAASEEVAALLPLGAGEHWTHVVRTSVAEVGIAILIAVVVAEFFERLSADEYRGLAREDRESISREFTRVTAEERASVRQEFERIAREERDMIKRDVFHYVYGHHIPQEVRQEIDSQIFRMPLVRRKMLVRLSLQPLFNTDASISFLSVRHWLRFELHNTTAEPQTYPFELRITRPPLDWLEEHVQMTGLRVDGCALPFELTPDEIRRSVIAQGEHLKFHLSRTAHQIEVLPNQPAVVTCTYSSVRDFGHDDVSMYFIHYVCDVDIIVTVPDWMSQVLSLSCASSAARPQVVDQQADTGFYNWRIDRPLLPGQTLWVEWKTRVDCGPAPLPASQRSDGKVGVRKLFAPGSANTPDLASPEDGRDSQSEEGGTEEEREEEGVQRA